MIRTSTGVIEGAQFIIFYGPPSSGKTTLLSQLPGVHINDTERGSLHLNVSRSDIRDLNSLNASLRALRHSDHQTIALDTVDRVDIWLGHKICQERNWRNLQQPGWGKGEKIHAEESERWIEEYIIPLLDDGFHFVTASHAVVRRFQPPGMDAYDHWEMHLHDAFALQLQERADAHLFINFKIRVAEAEAGGPKGVGGRERVIYTCYSAAHDAKSRIPIGDELPCTFEAIKPLLCGWQKPPRIDPRVTLAEKLSDLDQKHLHTFLLDRKQLNNGQTLADVPVEYAREVLSRLEEFKQAVRDFDYIPME